MTVINVPALTSDADVDHLFGKWSDFGTRCKLALREADQNGITVFTAGVCSRCDDPCASQMLSVNTAEVSKSEALCSTCCGHDAEAKRTDWFASEQRATR